MIDVSKATRYITVASPSVFTNNEWKQKQGSDYREPPLVYNDYALMKVLYMLRLTSKNTRPLVNVFRYEEPVTPLSFSGFQDTDIIFVVGHGNPAGLYTMGPDVKKGMERLIDIFTKDGSLKQRRDGKKIIIVLLSCRAGLGLHKGLARQLFKKVTINTTVGGAQGFTFGSLRTSYLARNEVLIRGLPWHMEYPGSITVADAERATSAREGKTITSDGKKSEIEQFIGDKKELELAMKAVIQQLQSTEVNDALDEIDARFRSHWLGLVRAQFELYGLAKKRSNLEFDMWFDLITEGYFWTDAGKVTDAEVAALLTGELIPTDDGLTSTR
jgi:hypothetical protein